MLFANICGVLSSFGMDILRGHAMTNPNGLVLDVVQFTDGERFLALNAEGADAVLHALEDVVAGRSTAADRLRGRRAGLKRRRAAEVAPLVHADGEASRRYTVLEIIAPDKLGLLYRISRAIATEGCAIDLVLIATEGRQGDRRVSHHQGRREADGRGPARADRAPATPAGERRMKLLKAIIRPNKVDDVKDALAKLNLSGMTVTEVRGHGKQKGHTAVYRGKEYNVSLLPKMQVEVVVADSIADEAIRAIVEAARTGEIGDGRVFVLPVEQSYRIRTGEREV